LSYSKLRDLEDDLDSWKHGLAPHLRLEFVNGVPATNIVHSRSPLLVSFVCKNIVPKYLAFNININPALGVCLSLRSDAYSPPPGWPELPASLVWCSGCDPRVQQMHGSDYGTSYREGVGVRILPEQVASAAPCRIHLRLQRHRVTAGWRPG
jgi:hypothetical protein